MQVDDAAAKDLDEVFQEQDKKQVEVEHFF